MTKYRRDFVTNSSSSSYIMIVPSERQTIEEDYYVMGEKGETDFGWQVHSYHDIHSRINFAYLQARIADKVAWKEAVVNMILEHTRVLTVDTALLDNDDNGYIDHQSSAVDGQNIEMFDSYQDLYDFIFGSDSAIYNDNDNY